MQTWMPSITFSAMGGITIMEGPRLDIVAHGTGLAGLGPRLGGPSMGCAAVTSLRAGGIQRGAGPETISLAFRSGRAAVLADSVAYRGLLGPSAGYGWRRARGRPVRGQPSPPQCRQLSRSKSKILMKPPQRPFLKKIIGGFQSAGASMSGKNPLDQRGQLVLAADQAQGVRQTLRAGFQR